MQDRQATVNLQKEHPNVKFPLSAPLDVPFSPHFRPLPPPTPRLSAVFEPSNRSRTLSGSLMITGSPKQTIKRPGHDDLASQARRRAAIAQTAKLDSPRRRAVRLTPYKVQLTPLEQTTVNTSEIHIGLETLPPLALPPAKSIEQPQHMTQRFDNVDRDSRILPDIDLSGSSRTSSIASDPLARLENNEQRSELVTVTQRRK